MQTVDFNRPDNRDLQIEIIRYREGDASQNRSEGRHRHRFHSVVWVNKGESRQEVDFNKYWIQPQYVMIIPAGVVHLEEEVQAWEGYTALFTDAFFSPPQLRLLYGFQQYAIMERKLLIAIPPAFQDHLGYYFELLYEEQFADSPNQTFILQNLFLALINKLENFVTGEAEDKRYITHRAVFQEFMYALEQHFLTQKTVLFYTDQLQLGARQLNDILKELIGATTQDLIIDRVMLEAKRALCFSQQSIKEIAIELGYDNQYYFSRIFKKRTTLSPEAFRNRYAS